MKLKRLQFRNFIGRLILKGLILRRLTIVIVLVATLQVSAKGFPDAAREISGRVTTENGDPLEGVTVSVNRPRASTLTNSMGIYHIAADSKKVTNVGAMLTNLQVTFWQTEIPATIIRNQQEQKITLFLR